jgi:hypothetical protein
MAHTCPECGSYCTCNGDIDEDIYDFDADIKACTCCPFPSIDDEDPLTDREEFESGGGFRRGE